MDTHAFSTATTGLLARAGNSAHQVIDAYRSGGERVERAAAMRAGQLPA